MILLDTSVLSALFAPDALIAAQAFNRRARLFTTDGDFSELASSTGLKLF